MSKSELESDIRKHLNGQFSGTELELATDQLRELPTTTRIKRCIAFASGGDLGRFDKLCKLAKIDYRDVIVAAEYDLSYMQLYDFNRPIPEAKR